MIFDIRSQLSTAEISLPRFRTPTVGPELRMVRDYLDQLPSAARGERRTVFVEPKLESGFPDLVVVYWSESITRGWDPARARITNQHTKLMHFLYAHGPATLPELKSHSARSARLLSELAEAGLVWLRGARWILRSLRTVFAVRRIIAIEAKLGSRRGGLQQAALNRWFASESYLLVDKVPKDQRLVREAKELGVGLLAPEQRLSCAVVQPALSRIPRSYASWLFNEWAWRADSMKESVTR